MAFCTSSYKCRDFIIHVALVTQEMQNKTAAASVSGNDGDDEAGIDIRRLHCHDEQAFTFLLSPIGCVSSRGQ